MPVALLYIVANIALGTHLFHGTWSLFQSMGWNNPRFNRWRKGVAADGSRRLVVVGNVSFPIMPSSPASSSTTRTSRASTNWKNYENSTRAERTADMSITLDSKIPEGPLADKWDNFKAHEKLVNPANKRKFKVIVVGTGLAGASAAATLGELGYQVDAFTFHDSPRRAHSIAAQGGINAAKNYKGDGDSRLPAVLRHDQGRRLPRPRGQRPPPRPGVGEHHRPDGRPGRPVRSRVRRPARQPLVRWGTGEPHVLRPRPDRPAAVARRVPAARPPDRSRRRPAVQPYGDRRHRGRRRPRRRHRRARPDDRRDQLALGARGRAGHRWLRQRVLLVDQRDGSAMSRRRGGRTAGARRSPTRATRRSTRPASRRPTSSSRSSP